jgi:excisionase family DNA binding protein
VARERPTFGGTFLSLSPVAFIVFNGDMEKTMLTTAEAAEILGVSRQHVVNLSNRGEIASIKIGAHRRIPLSEVERLQGRNALTPEREKSLRLHQALIGDLLENPDAVISKARENIARWLPQQRPDGMSARYLREWQHILDSGLDGILDALTATDEKSYELRENSPFAGVLSQERRNKVLKTLRNHQAIPTA